MLPDDADDELDPELDLLGRYESMIDTQVATINGIDDKAAYTARLIGILGGLILTATSAAVSTDAVEFSGATVGAFLLLGLGVSALFVSLVFAIITYLSSRFVYGPPAGLGGYLSEYQVDAQEYRDALLRGYSTGISANRRVVEENSKRFKWCLTALLVALLYLFGAGILFILPSQRISDVILIIGFTVAAALLARYVLREDYLTLDNKDRDDD